MKRLSMILGLVGMMTAPLYALDIAATAGELGKQLETLRATGDTRVKLTGSVNSDELLLLRQLPRTVRELDLSALTVTDGLLPEGMIMSTAVTSVALPATGELTIGQMAFADTDLQSIAIPASVRKIGDYAFASCPELTKVSIPQAVVLGTGVFKDCAKLTSVTLWPDIHDIPAMTFDGCKSLDMAIPATVNTIGDEAFRGTAMTVANLDNVVSVGKYAFADVPTLQEISMSSTSGITLGEGAFFNNELQANIPRWEGAVNDGVFAQNHGTIDWIVDSETIGAGAFANNSKASEITLGENVREIRKHAFRNMTALTAVHVNELGANVPAVDPEAFSGLEDDDNNYPITLTVASGTKADWASDPVWGRFKIKDDSTQTGILDFDGDVKIDIKRMGADVKVTSDHEIESVSVYDLAGLKMMEANPGTESYTVSDIAGQGVIVVKVQSGGRSKIVKLM